jgi:PTS system ascorbate-specific IIA component
VSVGIVVVTHGETAGSLVAEATFILGQDMSGIETVAYDQSSAGNSSLGLIRTAIERAESGDGVIVLTDLIGSSPCNQTTELLEEFNALMVSGVNLPMLLSVWNYRERPLQMVVRKAVESGRRGVKIFQR